jgi:two-component system OmpR family sensor kinase
MIRLPHLFMLLIGVNLLMAGLLHGWVYDALDKYVYEQKELLYKSALDESRETLGKAKPELWNSLSDDIGVKYSTNSMIYTRDSKELPSKVLEYISDTISSNGVVDPFTPDVYYPLGANHVFILGPLVLSSWHQYIIEWATFIASILGASFIIIIYYLLFKQHIQRIFDGLCGMRNKCEVTDLTKGDPLEYIYEMISVVKQEQVQLEKSNKMHIQSQRDLLHGVAHEFRSPMARMQFALEMIADGDLKEQAKMVDKMNHGIEELDDLVKELLSYSRIKHLNNRLKLESVAVNLMIEDSIEKVASFYPNVHFKYDPENKSEVLVDDRLIQRALANLLRNAGRFSKTLCEVTVSHTAEELTINIDDDGHGIPPGKRKRIFEPFTRLDPSRSRDSGGTGLGLAIVQSILEQHKGTIVVDDSELGGACFSLTIPCK